MNLQHLGVKIYLKNPEKVKDGSEFVPVFHEWIQNQVAEELLLDVADYAHVPAGPGVMLIGHQANYSVDFGAEKHAGLLYLRKTQLEGDNASVIRKVLTQALLGCERLQKNTVVPGLTFDGTVLRFVINDRLIAPNNAESFKAIQGDFQKVLGNDFEITQTKNDPRERLTIEARAKSSVTLEKLLSSFAQPA